MTGGAECVTPQHSLVDLKERLLGQGFIASWLQHDRGFFTRHRQLRWALLNKKTTILKLALKREKASTLGKLAGVGREGGLGTE